MSLDDFMEECRKKGATPLRYSSKSEGVNGSKHEKYESREYRKARALMYLLFGNGDGKLDDLMFNMMYGNKDIVVRNSDGYHYGRLVGYDGKRFYLDNYYFNSRLIDEVTYIETAMYSPGGRKVAIPADNGVISVGEIPSFEDPAYLPY